MFFNIGRSELIVVMILVPLIGAAITAYVAYRRGYSVLLWAVYAVAICVAGPVIISTVVPWFVLTVAIFPFVPIIHLLLLPRKNRKCPMCAEYVRSEAKVCKHCGRDIQVEAFHKEMDIRS
jgi:hypothetical protein